MKPSEKRRGYSLLALLALAILVLTFLVLMDKDEMLPKPKPNPALSTTDEATATPGKKPSAKEQDPTEPGGKEQPTPHYFQGMVIDMRTNYSVPEYRIGLYQRKAGFRNAPWTAAGDRISVSDITGRFSVECIPDKALEYQLKVTARGYYSGTSKVIEKPAGAVTTGIEIVLRPLPSIMGRVLGDDTQKGVAGALVYSFTESGKVLEDDPDLDHVLTDKQGRFRLHVEKPGEHTIVIRHADYRENVTAAVKVDEKESEFRLRQGFRISGKALAPDGLPIGGASLTITGDRAAGLPDWKRWITTEPDGTFTSPIVHPGIYRLELKRIPEFPTSFFGVEPVLVHNWDVERVRVGHRDDRASLLGTLISDKQPLPGAKVSILNVTPRILETLDPGYMLRFKEVAVTNGKGEFDLYGLWNGEYEIRFTLPDRKEFAPINFRVTCKSGMPWKEVFEVDSGSARGTILDRVTGDIIQAADTVCLLYDWDGEKTTYLLNVSPDDEGSMIIPWLAEGDYALLVLARGYGAEAAFFSSRGVGTERLNIWLDPSKAIPIRVERDPLSTEEPILSLLLRRAWFELPAGKLPRDRRGRYLVGRPLTIPLKVRCSGSGKILDIDVPNKMDFTIQPLSTIRGTVTTLREHDPVEHCRVCLVKSDGRNKKHSKPTTFAKAGFDRSVMTDARGFFEIRMPPVGTFEILLYGDHGFSIPLIRGKERVYGKPGSLEHRDLQIENCAVAGQLVKGDSKDPISSAEIYLYTKRNSSVMTLPDENGVFMFRNMPYEKRHLVFKALGYPFEPSRRVQLLPAWFIQHETYRLGEKGVDLELTLDGPFDKATTRPDLLFLNVRTKPSWRGERFPLSRLIRHGDEWIFTAHGLPPGGHTLHIKGTGYSGKVKVEAKEDEPVKATVVLD